MCLTYTYNSYYTYKYVLYEQEVIGVGTSSNDLTSSRYPLFPTPSILTRSRVFDKF